MRIQLYLPLLAVGFALLAVPVTADTVHVPGEQPTIQAGIDAASYGDTVVVACDIYYEHDIEMKSGICLTSETGLADCATIDAQQQGRVFYCDGVDSLASILGFTITGGLASDSGGGGMFCDGSSPTLTNCVFLANEAQIISGCSGGGMFCTSSSSPTLTDCAFSGNQAENGGGMWCSDFSSPTLTGCTFSENQADDHGGGMYCTLDSSPTLTDCSFVGNQARENGGGMDCRHSSSPVLAGCTFSGNQASLHTTAVGNGGGMNCWLGASPTLTGCTFSENRADSGGGIYCWNNCSPVLTGCTFSGNQANHRGGGMHCQHSSFPLLTDCTLSGNQADNGGGIHCFESPATLINCIIAFSTEGKAISCEWDTGTPALSCCDVYGNVGGDWMDCIAGQYGINGNFSEDPLFCDMYSDDFTLCANSPCLPDSNDCGVLIGAHGEGCPSCDSPVESTSWGAIKAMYR